MRGTRRTIVAATSSLAVVLGLGGVAAATSGHGSHSDDPVAGTTTSVSVHVNGEHHQRGKGPGSRHLREATSTTVDPATSTTVADATSTTVEEPTTSSTIEDETSTTLATTSTTLEPGEDHGKLCDNDAKGDEERADHAMDAGHAMDEAHDRDEAHDQGQACDNDEAHEKNDAGDHDGRDATQAGRSDGHGGDDGGSHQGRD